MIMGEIKDVVREHLGRTGLPTVMLDLSLEAARLTIEQHANFWWMQTDTDFVTVVDQASYSITQGTSGGLNIPTFKDARALTWKNSTDTKWSPVDLGLTSKEQLDVMYAEDDEGTPEEAIIEDSLLYIYPPAPQAAYDMRLYYWEYTSNPGNLNEDELTQHFPMALIYSALKWAYEMQLKDLQGASYWSALLGGQPFGHGGELAKMKRENFKRGWKDKVNFEPHLGPGLGRRRRMDNVQIYR